MAVKDCVSFPSFSLETFLDFIENLLWKIPFLLEIYTFTKWIHNFSEESSIKIIECQELNFEKSLFGAKLRACLLHPKSRNQRKGMLEVPWLAVELREWFASHRLTFCWIPKLALARICPKVPTFLDYWKRKPKSNEIQ